MLISGVQQFTLLDYPNKVAAIIFTPGCNMRCRFCHNKEFVLPAEIAKMRSHFIPEDAVLRFLAKRKGKLDGIVISGGEPTLQPDLIAFIRKVRDMGFLVKLDTNGALPDILMTCVHDKLVDYVAMDVKTLPKYYPALVGNMIDPANITKSITFLKQGHVPYEFRTTIIDGIHTTSLMQDIAALLAGSDALYLQKFRPETTLDPAFEKKTPVSDKTMDTYVQLCTDAGIKTVEIRM